MSTGAQLIQYNSTKTIPKDINNKDLFLGDKSMTDNNSILYDKLSEIKNEIKSDVKLEFDKLNNKLDSSMNLVVELRIKQVSLEKDIESLKIANGNKNKWIDYVIALAISGLVSFVMTRVVK